jgi:RNA polymerase sigma factor (sigma-70 family)
MDHSLKSDRELLATWVRHRCEATFHALVVRYANLVFMAARRTCGDDALAADASQLVFILLARKAPGLLEHPALAGWLQLAAVRTTQDLMDKNRREARKRQRFQTVVERQPHAAAESWRDMEPVLDAGLAALSEKDREAVLLRFYRGLSVKEVAVSLGISAAAAQKRIDRAIERLRSALERRGCRAGGTLAGVLLAGYASDAQAAMPAASWLAAKAVAGLPMDGSPLTPALTKGTSVMVPAAAMLAGGIWLAMQFETIAELEANQVQSPPARVADPLPRLGERRANPTPTALDARPVDWAEVARQLKASRPWEPVNPKARLELRFTEMDLARLETALDEIAAAGLPEEDQELLERRICEELGGPKGGPWKVMERFVGSFNEGSWKWTLGPYFHRWIQQQPDAAIDWLAKHVDRMDRLEFGFLDTSLHPLLATSPETAGRLLEAIPPERRLESLRSLENDEFSAAQQIAWAEMVRRHLPEKDRLKAIGWPIGNWSDGDGSPMELPEVSNYLERIRAGRAEREACILQAAEERMHRVANDSGKSLLDSASGFREWVGGLEPALVDRATGVLFSGRMGISADAEELLSSYHEKSGNDELLIPFLEQTDAGHDQAPVARRLAARLGDQALKRKYQVKFKEGND